MERRPLHGNVIMYCTIAWEQHEQRLCPVHLWHSPELHSFPTSRLICWSIAYSTFSISGTSCSGVFWGENRPTTFPSLSTKNFVKFLFYQPSPASDLGSQKGNRQSTYHLILPDSEVLFFNQAKTSFIFPPLTSDFFINGKVTPWLSWQNAPISSSVPIYQHRSLSRRSAWERKDLPGSCDPNSFDGNPRTCRPFGPNFWFNSSRPVNWGVKPLLVSFIRMRSGAATHTISMRCWQ